MMPIQAFLRRNFSAQDIEIILGQLDSPAFVWNVGTNKVTACNPQFIIFTGYSRPDLGNLNFSDLFPDLGKLKRLPVKQNTKIFIANNVSADVDIEVIELRSDENHRLVQIHTADQKPLTEVVDGESEARWSMMEQLLLAPAESGLEKALAETLKIGQEMTGCSGLAVYLQIPGYESKLVLFKSVGSVEFLPNVIEQKAIKNLRVPIIWRLGTSTSSVLHQKALAAQHAFLATSPIKPEAPLEGLLVITDEESNPSKDLASQLNLIAITLNSCFSFQKIKDESSVDRSRSNLQLSAIHMIKDQISDGIMFVDNDRNVVDINSSACYILGYFELEVLHQPLEKVMVCDCGITEIIDTIGETTGEVIDVGEIKIQQRSGKSIPVYLQIIPMNYAEDAPALAILISDLSTIKEFEDRSKRLEAQANIGEMIAVFAHEVRNPINNIRMGIENFSTLMDEPDAVDEEIDRLLSDVDRISDLMKSILSAYRTKEYKMIPIDLSGLIENIIYRWQPRMKRYGIDTKMVLNGDHLITKGDKRSLEQVFTNIIQNGINAMQESGGNLTVKISNEAVEDYIHVDIADNGPGIPDEIMDKIFNLYFSTKENGHGIGLAITKQIIDAHNGKIKVTSVPGGTVFRISLPVESNEISPLGGKSE